MAEGLERPFRPPLGKHEVQHQHVLMKPPLHPPREPQSKGRHVCAVPPLWTSRRTDIGPWRLVSSGIKQHHSVFRCMTKCFQGSLLWRRCLFEQDETRQNHQLCDSRPITSANAARGFPTRGRHRMAFLLSLIQLNPSEPTIALLCNYPISYEQEGTHFLATCLHHRSLVIKRPQQKQHILGICPCRPYSPTYVWPLYSVFLPPITRPVALISGTEAHLTRLSCCSGTTGPTTVDPTKGSQALHSSCCRSSALGTRPIEMYREYM